MSGLPRGERAEVCIKDDSELDWADATEADYEKVEVVDHITLIQETYVNSMNGHHSFVAKFAEGDDPNLDRPDAVTKRVSEYLLNEFGITDLASFGIRVVDIESDDVWVP